MAAVVVDAERRAAQLRTAVAVAADVEAVDLGAAEAVEAAAVAADSACPAWIWLV